MGIMDENNLSCFSELHKSTQLRSRHYFLKRSDLELPASLQQLQAQREQKCLDRDKITAEMALQAPSFPLWFRTMLDTIPLAGGKMEVLKSQAAKQMSSRLSNELARITHMLGLRVCHH